MTKKRAMGRGLSAILNDDSKNAKSASEKGAKDLIGNIVEIKISDIIPNPNNPRVNFDPIKIQELADSIKELGVIQPITVRKNDAGQYELISGERRFRASQLANLKVIPAFIRLANDQEMLEMALVENIQREDLDAIEVALTYEKLIEEIQLTQEELSKRVGKNRTSITNYLRLLKLEPFIQNAIRLNEISMGHGRALMGLENRAQQKEVFESIKQKDLSVRQAENLVKKLKSPQTKKASKEVKLPNHIAKGLKKFEDFFESEVQVVANKKGKGKVVIPFENAEDLEKLLKQLK